MILNRRDNARARYSARRLGGGNRGDDEAITVCHVNATFAPCGDRAGQTPIAS